MFSRYIHSVSTFRQRIVNIRKELVLNRERNYDMNFEKEYENVCPPLVLYSSAYTWPIYIN